MDIIHALVLGMVQGLTEFIPVSSSAHLVLVPYFAGWGFPPVLFDIIAHLGTLLAIILYMRKDILELFTKRLSLIPVLLIACIPTGFMGFFFKDFFEGLFENPMGVSVLLLITGFVLWFSSGVENKNTADKPVSYIDAFWIGLAQGCAIAPGISRSGLTISAGLFRGLSKETSVRFAFLLFIPAIIGATIFKIRDFSCVAYPVPMIRNYILGGIVSFISGYYAIKLVFSSIKKGLWKVFAYYCWGFGVFSIVFILMRG